MELVRCGANPHLLTGALCAVAKGAVARYGAALLHMDAFRPDFEASAISMDEHEAARAVGQVRAQGAAVPLRPGHHGAVRPARGSERHDVGAPRHQLLPLRAAEHQPHEVAHQRRGGHRLHREDPQLQGARLQPRASHLLRPAGAQGHGPGPERAADRERAGGHFLPPRQVLPRPHRHPHDHRTPRRVAGAHGRPRPPRCASSTAA
ncbi:hypothetical protein ON010_g16138 [Phytophthora cinnamomi]|nr:hypothetical protein ON010_g16138 [Phytophthora cinnamomi]